MAGAARTRTLQFEANVHAVWRRRWACRRCRQPNLALVCVGIGRLIPLKANVWLDLRERVAKGEPVDARNVRKHLLDVVRLSQLLAPDMRIAVRPGLPPT